MPPNDAAEISSVKALLSDARERIKEAEDRSKDFMDRLEERLGLRFEAHERIMTSLTQDLSKWTPLLTNLQKADENKKTLIILLVTSFITNLATIIIGIFVWFARNGAIK